MSAAASLYAPGIPWYATRSFFLSPFSTSSPFPTPDAAVASPVAAAETILVMHRNFSGTTSPKVCAGVTPVAPPAPREATAISWRHAEERARSERCGNTGVFAGTPCLTPRVVARAQYDKCTFAVNIASGGKRALRLTSLRRCFILSLRNL